MDRTELLVIGAGPYGTAVAARAIEAGIETRIIGEPMGFWRENMPRGMFLRSGPDWHLDASGVHTFEAFLEEKDVSPADVDPVPISVFLEYAAWFQDQKHVVADRRMAQSLQARPGGFMAGLADGQSITAERVVAAPGNRFFQHRPDWALNLPPGVAAHTCELVDFHDLSGSRVLIVGGRQSAYEWAALLADHGAERIDIVHRHDVPEFSRVSWRFADEYVDLTVRVRGWWRSLDQSRRDAIARQFWEVGRLTLEWWLTPRLAGAHLHRWPRASVADARTGGDGTTEVTLSNGQHLRVDRIVLATGYQADISRVPYLGPVTEMLASAEGMPVLDEAFQSSVPGLYFPGFVSTRDFGPFFGFTKGCPAAATLIVDHLLAGA